LDIRQAAAPLIHDPFRHADRESYDAVVLLGMLDLGVDGGRSVVDIPVAAPLQAALHLAAQAGEPFGVVCYHPSAIPRHRAQTSAYAESFLAAARALIEEDGADVIGAKPNRPESASGSIFDKLVN
jgi:enhancing lycopene biosynthesis protein 2